MRLIKWSKEDLETILKEWVRIHYIHNDLDKNFKFAWVRQGGASVLAYTDEDKEIVEKLEKEAANGTDDREK